MGFAAGPAKERGGVLPRTATSSNPGLIQNPTVNYTNPAAIGTLTFAPVINQFGTATISVVVTDDGGTANGGIDSVTNTFIVTITAVNDPPTLSTLTNITIVEDAGLQTVNLTGISPGPANEAGQVLTVTSASSNPGLIPNPTVNYTSANSS